MRTLKKTLCLVLAVVLCFGLVGTAFAGNLDKFSDAKDIDANYVEAVDLFTGLGIVEGDAGAFDANGSFTRAAMCKIAAYMKLGAAAKNLSGTTATYKDVTADYWAMPFIAYCDSEGLVEGYGDGNFGPNDPITGFQGAVLFLRVLGYGVKGEYSDSDWTLVASKDGIAKKIFNTDLITDGANSGNALQRDQAIQMAFNTLTKVGTVKWSSLLNDYVLTNSTTLGTSVDPTYLGVENYKLTSPDKPNDYGVGGHVWKSGTKTVSGWYADDVLVAEYTDLAALTSGELYKLELAATDVVSAYVNGTPDADVLAAIKGVIAGDRGSSAKPLAAFNGITLALYDTDPDTTAADIKAVLKCEYLAKVTKVQAEAATTEAFLEMTVYDVNLVLSPVSATAATKAAVKVYTKDYDVTGIAKDDYVLVSPKGNTGSGFAAPLSLKEVTPVTASVTAYDSSKSTVTFGGTTYGYSVLKSTAVDEAAGTYAFAPTTYDFYLNSIGDVIGVKVNTGSTANLEFAYVSAAEVIGEQNILTGNKVTVKSAKVSAVFMDGSAAILDLEAKKATAEIFVDQYFHKTTSGATGGTAPAAGNKIEKGELYFMVKGETAATDEYYVLANGANTTINSALDGRVYSFTKSGDVITLSSRLTTTSTPAQTAALAATDVNFDKASPAVVIDSGSAKYASSETKLVLRSAEGVVSTITGYANFKDETFTTASGKVIVAVTTSTGVVNVLVIGATATGATTANAYGVCTGAGKIEAGKQYYNFLVNGAEVAYTLADDVSAPVATTPYAIYTNDTGVVTKLETGATVFKTGAVTIGGDFIVVGTTIMKTDKTFATVNTAVNPPVAGTYETGDTITALFSTDAAGVNHVEAIFTSK